MIGRRYPKKKKLANLKGVFEFTKTLDPIPTKEPSLDIVSWSDHEPKQGWISRILNLLLTLMSKIRITNSDKDEQSCSAKRKSLGKALLRSSELTHFTPTRPKSVQGLGTAIEVQDVLTIAAYSFNTTQPIAL